MPRDWAEVSPAWMTAALKRDLVDVVVAGSRCSSEMTEPTAAPGSESPTPGEQARPVVFVKGEGSFRGVTCQERQPLQRARALRIFPPHTGRPSPSLLRRHRPDAARLRNRDGGRHAPKVANHATPRATCPSSTSSTDSDRWRRSTACTGTALELADLRWLQTWRATPGWTDSFRSSVPIGAERARDLLPDDGARPQHGDPRRLLAALHGLLRDGPPHPSARRSPCRKHLSASRQPRRILGLAGLPAGCWAQDLAYFLVSALTVEDRRSFEHHLVAAYRDALGRAAGERPSEAESWVRYASSHPYGLAVWLATHRSDRAQRPEVCRALIERFAAAFMDHGS